MRRQFAGDPRCPTTAATPWCPAPGVEAAQGFVQGSSPDPGGSSPKLEILKPGPWLLIPVMLEAALGQGYAMSCAVGNTKLPSGAT